MPSKEEYKKVLNKLLGTDVDWTKLSKEELASLATLFSEPEMLARKLGLDTSLGIKAAREKFVETGFTIFQEWEGPLAKIARRMLGIEKEKKEEAPAEKPPGG